MLNKKSLSKKILGRKASTSWEFLQNQTGNRDVYQDQQLERGATEKPKDKTWVYAASSAIGVGAFILIWFMCGIIAFMASMLGGSSLAPIETKNSETANTVANAHKYGVPDYWVNEEQTYDNTPITVDCFLPTDDKGNVDHSKSCASKPEQVKRPQWHIDATEKAMKDAGIEVDNSSQRKENGLGVVFFSLNKWRILLSFLSGLGAFLVAQTYFSRQWEAQNAMSNNVDINDYANDQHIAVPEEVAERYGLFPDVGAHSPVQVSSMLSHMMLKNKGIKQVYAPVRAEEDIVDENGNILTHKGQPVTDSTGRMKIQKVPMFDTDFGQKLFEASGMQDKNFQNFFDATVLKYNPGGKNIEKLGGQDTYADHINELWTLPPYEPQRPAGAYIVDQAPVNTMVLAITRAGKGQTYIEPVIDMWLRESDPNNMLVNDPKGELLVKHYVRAVMRGFQVVQFNLINPLKTDIYNPLGLAAEAAREGDFTAAETYVENIAKVFFPVDGSDDPVWPNAANNAFKRTAYGLIDFYLEEERLMRKQAEREGWSRKILDNKLDAMWGKLTLYNCYQFFVQLSAKKIKDPVKDLEEKIQNNPEDYKDEDGEYTQETQIELEKAQKRSPIWDGNKELDMLTLFFNATDKLPRNEMRTSVSNSDKSLRAMGGAEKMLASVYGIAITAMSFFTDKTISTLTSGTPSQNVDLASLSFPRRIGVRFHPNFAQKYHLVGHQVRWSAYADKNFTEDLGKDFYHDDIITQQGYWAKYLFKGIFPNQVSYIKLEVVNSNTGNLMNSFYFKFTKGYRTNLSGRTYMTEPVTGKKIIQNGILEELVPNTQKGGFVPGSQTFKDKGLNVNNMTEEEIYNSDELEFEPIDVNRNILTGDKVAYTEQPKAVFLVTPPHLMNYAKLILILVKQLVDLNFDQSYTAKPNQKPLYKTRYMLDELGNLQSEGHGIEGFETMLSIGLGQSQQFTLILQTLQQLKDVYGDSVDKIVQGNAQPLYSKIATPEGWKSMGEMEEGTKVLVPGGGITEVTGVYPRGIRKVYQVTRADGASTVVCNEHLWEVELEEDALKLLSDMRSSGDKVQAERL